MYELFNLLQKESKVTRDVGEIMRKTLLSALIGSALAVTGTAHASLLVDFDGAGAASGTYAVTAFDWAQTSFLAQGGNAQRQNSATKWLSRRPRTLVERNAAVSA